MRFEKPNLDMKYICIANYWADSGDYKCGYIEYCLTDCYWYFYPTSLKPLSCNDLKTMSKKLSELNIKLNEENQ